MLVITKSLIQSFVDEIIASIKAGVSLNKTIGKSERGNMIGYSYVNACGDIIRIQAFTKEGGKNSKIVLSIEIKDEKPIEIVGVQARDVWKAIHNPSKFYKNSGIVDKTAVNDVLKAFDLL